MQQTFVERRRNRARPNHCILVDFRGKSRLAKVGDALPSFRPVFTRQGSQVQTLLRPLADGGKAQAEQFPLRRPGSVKRIGWRSWSLRSLLRTGLGSVF